MRIRRPNVRPLLLAAACSFFASGTALADCDRRDVDDPAFQPGSVSIRALSNAIALQDANAREQGIRALVRQVFGSERGPLEVKRPAGFDPSALRAFPLTPEEIQETGIGMVAGNAYVFRGRVIVVTESFSSLGVITAYYDLGEVPVG